MPEGGSFDDELAAATARLSLLVRRLRSLSPRALESHREVLVTALNELAELSTRLNDRDLAPFALDDHVLPDAIAVVGGDLLDALRASRAGQPLAQAVRVIETLLASTR